MHSALPRELECKHRDTGGTEKAILDRSPAEMKRTARLYIHNRIQRNKCRAMNL